MLHGVDEQTQVAATKEEQEQKFNFIKISSLCLWSNDDYLRHKYKTRHSPPSISADRLSWGTTYSKYQTFPSQSPVIGTFRKWSAFFEISIVFNPLKANTWHMVWSLFAVCAMLLNVCEKLLKATAYIIT